MTELNGMTPDIAQDNIQELKKLFPEVFTEGKIDFDKLKQVLGEYIDDNKERYNFTWNGKGRALRFAQTPSTGTLRPCREESKGWDNTQNLYIEGDNLEVLKLLQKSYHKKVKMIYIDPPYNTGNDFVYTDDFSNNIDNYKRITGQISEDGSRVSSNSETSGRYHTNWLNMMFPRLKLARNLLTEDGVIFISIDDNEIENLKKICNEVFGENNFIGNIIVKSNPRGSQSTKEIAELHEYLMVYAKNLLNVNIIGHALSEDMLSEYKFEEDGKKYRLLGLRQRGGFWRRSERPNLYYPLYVNETTGGVSLTKISNDMIPVLPIQPSTMDDGTWRWSKDKVSNCSHELIAKRVQRNESTVWDIFQKDYLVADENGTRRTKAKSIWDEKEINYQNGTVEVKNLLASGAFDYAKPVYLIRRAIEMVGLHDNDIILDFFSGSATTAHAIIQSNVKDRRRIKFIIVQLPEPCRKQSEAYKRGFANICEIGKERIRRAGEKIKEEAGLMGQDLDVGFKVFKLDSSNLKKWNPDYNDLETSMYDSINNYIDGRTEMDVVYEIMIKMGLDLTYPVVEHIIADKKVYEIGAGGLMMCLDDEITTDVAQGMIKLRNELQPEIWKVVFKDNGFASDSNKTNIKEILKCAGLKEEAFTTV
ncbi:MAG: site-specific DNA-methyltransferase [Negativicutes bacterium]|nr:site-specific DNA-methyltransferase [Negativicutes bacterium]